MRRLFLLAPLATFAVAASVALSACGGGEGSAADAGSQTPTANPVIDQDRLKFIPTSLTVKAGTPVLFKNSETAIHTVTIERKNISGVMKKGDELTWTPPGTGTYRITCDYHPQMRATITVVD
jgi:plastocyanin